MLKRYKRYIKSRILFLLLPACTIISFPEMVAATGHKGLFNWNEHQEHILLHTDRDIYIAGETVYFDFRLTAGSAVFQQSRFAYLTLRGPHGSINHIGFILENGRFQGAFFLSDTLSTGYYEIVAFTNWMRNFGEESYFRKTILIANRFDTKMALEGMGNDSGGDGNYMNNGNSGSYGSNGNDSNHGNQLNNGNPPAGESPDSAARGTLRETNMSDDFTCLITTEGDSGKRQSQKLQLTFRNHEDPVVQASVRIVSKQSIDTEKLIAEAATLAKQTWPDNAHAATGHEIPRHRNGFRMETSHQFVSGRVVSKNSRTPVSDARVILNTPDTSINILYVETDKNGTFNFSVNSFYYGRNLFLTVDPATVAEAVEIVPDNKFQFSTPFMPTGFSGLAGKRDFIAESQEIVKINKLFGIGQPVFESAQSGQQMPARLFANPVYSISPSAFEPLTDLREISRELVSVWRIRAAGNGFTHALIGETTRTMLDGEPVVFLNGIISFDISPFIHLGSKQIHRIQIHNLDWVHGDMHFPGIVSIITTNDALTDIQIPETSVRRHLDSPRLATKYAHPMYENNHFANHDTPDLRQLRYWNPNVVPDERGLAELDWYTGDLAGSYLILVQAYTQNGHIRIFSKEIEVK